MPLRRTLALRSASAASVIACSVLIVAMGGCTKSEGSTAANGETVQPEEVHQLAEEPATEALPWKHDDWAGALAAAKAEIKPVVVDLWAPWCHTCISMQKTVFTRPEVVALKDRFIWLAIDTDKAVNAEAVAQLDIPAWPTFYVLAPDGKTLTRHVGGASLDELVDFLKDGLAAQAGIFQDASVGALVTAADRAATAGDHAAAEQAYRAALAAAGPAAPERFALRVDLASALTKQKKAAACKELVDETFADQGKARSAAGPDYVSWIVSCVGTGEDKAALEPIMKRAIAEDGPIWSVLNNEMADLSADDRSDALRILREMNDELGNKEEAKRLAQQQRKVLDDAVAGLDDPELLAGYAWPREEVYVYLGEGEALVDELTRLTQQLPKSYDPPYRLAWLLNQIGKSDEALPYVKDALTKVYGPRKIRAWHLLASVQAGRKDIAGEIKAWEGMKAEVDALPEGHRMKTAGSMADENLARLAKLKVDAAPTESKGG
jgi:thiol-disulfide isomerase/thioredoxin